MAQRTGTSSRTGGGPSLTTTPTGYQLSSRRRRWLFNACRRILRGALDSGEADALGLPQDFIIAMPFGGGSSKKARNPFTMELVKRRSRLRAPGEAFGCGSSDVLTSAVAQ